MNHVILQQEIKTLALRFSRTKLNTAKRHPQNLFIKTYDHSLGGRLGFSQMDVEVSYGWPRSKFFCHI